MKTKLVAVAALLVSLSARAYAEWPDEKIDVNVKLCKTVGQIGQAYYKAALQGRHIVMPYVSSDWLKEMGQHVESDVYKNYRKYDEEKIFMREAAYCFENFDRLSKALIENDQGQK
jgi:hypothetical protein